jgi:hypothetical protein
MAGIVPSGRDESTRWAKVGKKRRSGQHSAIGDIVPKSQPIAMGRLLCNEGFVFLTADC